MVTSQLEVHLIIPMFWSWSRLPPYRCVLVDTRMAIRNFSPVSTTLTESFRPLAEFIVTEHRENSPWKRLLVRMVQPLARRSTLSRRVTLLVAPSILQTLLWVPTELETGRRSLSPIYTRLVTGALSCLLSIPRTWGTGWIGDLTTLLAVVALGKMVVRQGVKCLSCVVVLLTLVRASG